MDHALINIFPLVKVYLHFSSTSRLLYVDSDIILCFNRDSFIQNRIICRPKNFDCTSLCRLMKIVSCECRYIKGKKNDNGQLCDGYFCF